MTEPTPVGYYEFLDFNNPMTDETAERLVAKLAATEPSRVLDIGCGWAELLLRLLAACETAVGHGVDHDEILLQRARDNARHRRLSDRVTFTAALGGDESADLVLNIGAEHVFGTVEDALERLRPITQPGGRLLFGTQFWERTPTPELAAAIGPLPTLPALIDIATALGWRPIGLTVASADDWDHFEFGFLADWEQFVLSDTTADGGADRARAAADEHRTAYLERRGVLGFAFLTLGRPQVVQA
ncbi:MAG: class I SAM-dependent methyltransferase [Actinomycetota bacterium]